MTDSSTTLADEIQAQDAKFVLQTYRRTPLVFERGAGVHLYDVQGREYLDFISGVGVVALGHSHPAMVQALTEQLGMLIHCSNLFHHPLQGRLAQRLTSLCGLDRAFFCNSGTEAVEASLKFARRYWYSRGEARRRIVALEHAFHGRTVGSLSLTWDPHYREPFAPLLADVVFVPADDPEALREAMTPDTAAIIVEAIQGEGGVRPLSPAFAQAVSESCTRTGALLVADEVQCGLGRTGHPLHARALGLSPDLCALGKVLGAGVPIGAALLTDRVASSIEAGDHGSTYGGNLLACRAALVFLDALRDGLMQHVQAIGPYFEEAFRRLASRHSSIVAIRGAGVMWGLDLAFDAAPVVDAARERYLLVNRTGGTVLRMLPPFIVTKADVDRAVGVLDEVLTQVETKKGHAA